MFGLKRTLLVPPSFFLSGSTLGSLTWWCALSFSFVVSRPQAAPSPAPTPVSVGAAHIRGMMPKECHSG
jgi:hypothetical protein